MAVVGAMMIAVNPMAPADTAVVSAPRTVSAEVQLAADPITSLIQVATETVENIKTLADRLAADPVPVLTKVLQNQKAYAAYLSGNPTPAGLLAVVTSQATNLVNVLGVVVSLDVLSRIVGIPAAPLLSLAGGAVLAVQNPLNIVAIMAGAFLNGVQVPTVPNSTVQLFGVFTPGGPTAQERGGSVHDVLDIREIVADAIAPFTPPAALTAGPTSSVTAEATTAVSPAPKRSTGATGRSAASNSAGDHGAQRRAAVQKTAHSGGSSGRSARTAD
ncbi:hypothetical protein MANY_14930 [Mycolicibacterium anyangense]|uniref:Uncharacterized protein n=1 Tax=Mycolicibacterium anyangense TaxID=1431246 RepID=A0A6N4W2J4_9MYCO|nr:hypothetical protein MANY_14930 [Mycolicibacterium anyangense]